VYGAVFVKTLDDAPLGHDRTGVRFFAFSFVLLVGDVVFVVPLLEHLRQVTSAEDLALTSDDVRRKPEVRTAMRAISNTLMSVPKNSQFWKNATAAVSPCLPVKTGCPWLSRRNQPLRFACPSKLPPSYSSPVSM
jgi:hypothetical protein